ncbi:MAG: SOS response-associated peptidase [Oscillospiraceae bacterium]|nr:SOS response-associated peptidase [Oscillospiraceae bacterium]
MCGRYYIPEGNEYADINSILDLIKRAYTGSPALAKMKQGEIFPTEIVPVITKEAPQLMKWGFVGFNGKGLVINARLETAAEKPMFKMPFSSHRCLIPAGYYYEWKKEGSQKQKFAIMQKDPIYMAGLYQIVEAESLPLFVILTREASSDIRFIHDRMPVILSKEVRDKWLSGQLNVQQTTEYSEERFTYDRVV